MSIRSLACIWLETNHPGTAGIHIRASRFYPAALSWTKRTAWAFEIALRDIEPMADGHYALLCQKALGSADFHYLLVPATYLSQNRSQLYIRSGERLSLFFSAEPDTLFVDQRGTGLLAFQQFHQVV